METNSKKVLAALPSFEDYLALAEQIKKLSIAKMQLENEIKRKEAEAFQAVMTDSRYFKQGKVVSVSYFENAYKFVGLDGELLKDRNVLAETISTLEELKTRFDIYKMMHDLYKALAYQEKGMS